MPTLIRALAAAGALSIGAQPTPLPRFDRVVLLETTSETSANVHIGDVNGDGHLDIVLAKGRHWGLVDRVLLGDGRGGFPSTYDLGPASDKTYSGNLVDLDGDGDLDVVISNDTPDPKRIYLNDSKGRFRDATAAWWPEAANVGEDDNMAAFLDVDSDGDADFVVGSLSGPDRLLVNDGKGRLQVRLDVFDGAPTPGTLGLALADLDADGRMDVVQGQGEHPKAIDERVFLGRGLAPDKAPPSITMVGARDAGAGRRIVVARVHDRKSPSLPFEWKRVVVEWPGAGSRVVPMRWYGEYLWRADWPADVPAGATFRVCATDAAGNSACATP